VKRHPFDPVSFVIGGVLIALGALIGTGQTTQLFSAWLAPAAVILLGVLVLVAGWRSSRSADAANVAG
jgi:hypothetical protein